MQVISNLNKTITIVELKSYLNNTPFFYKCKLSEALEIIDKYNLNEYELTFLTKNSKQGLLDYENLNARIEPGAIIRDNVVIKDNAIILMGAVINVGAIIGENTMIDMNAVIGSKAVIGKNCHISSGSVIAGVLEPVANKNVIIEDNVFIGANAVILEGVKVGKNSIIGAGSIVTHDVEEKTVVYGNPARFIKSIDNKITDKTKINEALR